MGKVYRGKSGTLYQTLEKPLAKGGEGEIFSLAGNTEQVAKVFRAERRTLEREEKVC